VVRVVPRLSLDLRCAICHDLASNAGACTSCGTLTHGDCRAEAGACPTLGCARRVRVVVTPRGPSLLDDVRALPGELLDWVVNSTLAQVCLVLLSVLVCVLPVQRHEHARALDRSPPPGWSMDITSKIPGG
jgi:hypothetical protein